MALTLTRESQAPCSMLVLSSNRTDWWAGRVVSIHCTSWL